MRSLERDYYKILQIDPEADKDVIDAAYKVLAARYHPESDLTGVHEIRLAELTRAHAVLSDEGRQRVFDIERADRLGLVNSEAVVSLPIGATEMVEAPMGRGLGARLSAGPTGNGSGNGGANGTTLLDFGRYAGMSLRDVANDDPSYLRWLARHSSGIRFRHEIQRLLRDDLEA